jgi:hypothetical protein
MYTKQPDGTGTWDILDPDGDYLVTIQDETSADILLSHLNRG